jgi:curved DNA-binding protein
MKFKDYYEILGVARTATIDEIKKSYKKLAHQFHPDVTKDPKGEEKFKEIGEAYATLKDKEKRAAYDDLGKHGAGEEFRPPPNWGDNKGYSQNQYGQQNGQGNDQPNPFDDIDLADLFASFSSRQRQSRNQAAPGQDYELAASISLADAYAGTTLDLSFSVPEQDAQGLVKQVLHTFKARIPKGVSNGTKMLLRGKGGKGFNGGENGNLYLNISFLPHKLFKVVDHDLFIDLPITPWEAALGATVAVPTLQGAVNLKIPAGSKSGQKMRIAKHGMPKKHDEHGDLFAVLQIVVPSNLSDKERELLTALKENSSFNPRVHFD